MPGRSALARARSPLTAGVLLGILILVAAVLYANSGARTTHVTAGGTGTHADAASGAVVEVAVSLVEMRIVPDSITVAPGQRLVLQVSNDGKMRHDLRLADGARTPLLAPGERARLDAGVIDKATDGWCTVAGHRAAGMKLAIRTDGPHAAQPGAGEHGPDGPNATASDLAATPAAGWKARDAVLPPAPSAVVHEVTWQITDVVREVAPGVRQTTWTFDGQVPGPVLRGKVGDTFVVHVRNATAMTHNIDFHAESGPPAKVMTPVPPGESHTYRFVATHSGAWLYHCGIEPMIQHLANGMYGALIVDPPDLAAVDREFVLVGSEFFFGPQGGIGDYPKMLADRPDAVVFNGYPFAYQHTPIAAAAGERVRVWVVAAGPNRGLAFHVVGAPFTTTFLDGAYGLRPGDAARGGAQSLPVPVGAGGFVEFTFDRPGRYPFLTHALNDAALGASGAFEIR